MAACPPLKGILLSTLLTHTSLPRHTYAHTHTSLSSRSSAGNYSHLLFSEKICGEFADTSLRCSTPARLSCLPSLWPPLPLPPPSLLCRAVGPAPGHTKATVSPLTENPMVRKTDLGHRHSLALSVEGQPNADERTSLAGMVLSIAIFTRQRAPRKMLIDAGRQQRTGGFLRFKIP